jgi:signal transduction histidine kinase
MLRPDLGPVQSGAAGRAMSLSMGASDHGVRHIYLTAVALPILLAAVVGAWLAFQIERLSQAASFIDGSDRAIAIGSEVEKRVCERDAELRAFLATGDPDLLEAYHRADAGVALDELVDLLAGQPALAAEARALQRDYRRWEEQTEKEVAEGLRGRTSGAIAVRPATVEALRARSAEIVAREKSERLAWIRRFERRTELATAGAVALLALLAGAVAVSARRRIRLIDELLERERDALGKAQEALRARDIFLANLSHELRTPLTPILGWVTLARTRRLRGETLGRALALIERNAKAEAQIVDDLLDVSHIAAGVLRIAQEIVDPVAVVESAVEVVEPSARAKDIALDLAIASPLPVVFGDPARLRQVVCNLLSNAVKFTPRGGRVEIRLAPCGAGVRLVVADDGVGIAADFLPHVFDDFRQADGSATRAHGGLGLGLAIVKHLVELHGGKIEAESRGSGRGATFTVTLPAASTEVAARLPAPALVPAPDFRDPREREGEGERAASAPVAVKNALTPRGS